MDRKDRTVLRGSPRFLLLAMCASLAAALPVQAVEPATTARATQLADGIWTVQGRAIPGSRRCGDWLVMTSDISTLTLTTTRSGNAARTIGGASRLGRP